MIKKWFIQFLMGNNTTTKRTPTGKIELQSTSDLNKTISGEDSVWQEEVEIRQCCGVKIETIRRKKIIWENSFISNCESLVDQFPWARDMIQLVSNCELTKTKYFNEVEALKNLAAVEEPAETEILHTPAEVEQFKSNLKRSVIMSFSGSRPPSSEYGSQRIAGILDPRNAKGRLSIQRASYLNKQATKNANINFERSKSVLSNGSFRKSIISLIDDTISSVMGTERQISNKTAHELQIFLKFSMILERHLGEINCMLGRIKRLFIVYLEKTYRDLVAASKVIGDYIDDVKQFLVLLREAVMDYYNLWSFGEDNSFILNEENILSACTAVLFKDPTFYAQTFRIVSLYCGARQGKFSLILDHLKNSPPERFGVKQKFCLNSKTVAAYIGSLNSQQSLVQSIQFKDLYIQNEQPFKICMQNLKDLDKSKSPISKMKAIVACSQGITSEIQRFYQRNGLKKQTWMLDADQVLSIFCYILVSTRLQNLLSHLFILQNFATGHQLISMGGYYVSVINCAVQQLQNEYQKQILTQKL